MSKAQEHEALIQAAEAREAGVAELLTFYARIEEVYAAAARASQEEQPTVTTNSTNSSRVSR